ncbi:MAG: nuclear transport factor 2 family protein [Thermoplasmata archaeon]
MVEGFLEDLKRAWEAGDATNAARLYHEDAEHQDGVGRQGTLFRGRVAIRNAIQEMFAVRDPRFTVTSLFSIGDRGAAEWTFSWGDSQDESRLAIRGASVFEFREGLVAKEVSYYDPVPAPV